MKKGLFLVALAISICITLNDVPVLAAGKALVNDMYYSEVPTSGTPAQDLNYSVSTRMLRAAKGITTYADTISYSGTTVYFSGETYATDIAAKIGNQVLQLEVWDGYDWQFISTGSYYAENAAFYTAGFSYKGTSGKYYRVVGKHLVTIDGITYTTGMNYSDYIYVK